MPVGAAASFAARADDFRDAIYSGVGELRQACGPIADDPRLTAAAQRHADDLATNGIEHGHVGSDGSSPWARVLDAGYVKPRDTSEILFWGSGSHANPATALDLWMQSPPHREVILDCAFTAVGFAIAWTGNTLIAVGDFAAS
ncbi:CAP domain-containing protein [Mycobacterium sp. 1245111.1]|uniref:CAP domain-containing protein n=1 Tax=Mycobacterium sp. 1245111.1 TaxID=1834073 RepID=UPI001E584166|nr:CAP domain-containing protein [Mycobacterium sp. 1245111.1]